MSLADITSSYELFSQGYFSLPSYIYIYIYIYLSQKCRYGDMVEYVKVGISEAVIVIGTFEVKDAMNLSFLILTQIIG